MAFFLLLANEFVGPAVVSIEEWCAVFFRHLLSKNPKPRPNRIALPHVTRTFYVHRPRIELVGNWSRTNAAVASPRRSLVGFDDDLTVR